MYANSGAVDPALINARRDANLGQPAGNFNELDAVAAHEGGAVAVHETEAGAQVRHLIDAADQLGVRHVPVLGGVRELARCALGARAQPFGDRHRAERRRPRGPRNADRHRSVTLIARRRRQGRGAVRCELQWQDRIVRGLIGVRDRVIELRG